MLKKRVGQKQNLRCKNIDFVEDYLKNLEDVKGIKSFINILQGSFKVKRNNFQ